MVLFIFWKSCGGSGSHVEVLEVMLRRSCGGGHVAVAFMLYRKGSGSGEYSTRPD
jgi:hypothetical protein